MCIEVRDWRRISCHCAFGLRCPSMSTPQWPSSSNSSALRSSSTDRAPSFSLDLHLSLTSSSLLPPLVLALLRAHGEFSSLIVITKKRVTRGGHRTQRQGGEKQRICTHGKPLPCPPIDCPYGSRASPPPLRDPGPLVSATSAWTSDHPTPHHTQHVCGGGRRQKEGHCKNQGRGGRENFV